MKRRRWAALMLACFASSTLAVSEAPRESPELGIPPIQDQLRQNTDQVLTQFGGTRSEAALDAELGKLGWQAIRLEKVEDEAGVSSEQYCGTADPRRAYQQWNGTWLIVGKWWWNDASCGNSWLYDDPMSPADGVAMGVTDSYDKPVDVPATDAGGKLYDQYDDYWYGASPSTFNRSAVGYTVADKVHRPNSFVRKFVGHHGIIWFYLDRKPTTAGDHYLQVCWMHSWKEPKAYIDSLEIEYPWKFKVKFAGGMNVQQWRESGACQKSKLVYES